MIDLTKKWKTRDGRKVTRLAPVENEPGMVAGIACGLLHYWNSETGHNVQGLSKRDLVPADGYAPSLEGKE